MLVLALAACGKSAEPETTVSLERAKVLEFHVVDHDSDFMRRVVAEAKADPRAAGIAVREDVWMIDSTPERVGHDYFLEARDDGSITGKVRLDSYFANVEVPRGHQLAYEQTSPGTWRSFYLHSPIALGTGAIERASQSESRVHIDLTDAARAEFGALTKRITGGKLAAISHGTVISAPVVLDQIQGGMVTISMDREADAAALTAALQPL